MNNAVIGKTMENVRKRRNMKLVTTEKRRNYLASKPSYYVTKFFTEQCKCFSKRNEKTETLVNKLVYLGFSILELSKILMNEIWYYYVKPKYVRKVKLCYIDRNNLIAYIKTDDIYKDIARDVEFDTSNYELECNSNERPLPRVKNEKVIELMKDELGGKILTRFVGFRAKTYSYVADGGGEDKKAKDTQNYVTKIKLKFENYKNCLKAQFENKVNYLEKNKIECNSIKEFIKNNKSILKIGQIIKSEMHNVFTEEINKIALSSNDDKRTQSIDSIEIYAYGTTRDLVIDDKKIKCSNIIKRYKND